MIKSEYIYSKRRVSLLMKLVTVAATLAFISACSPKSAQVRPDQLTGPVSIESIEVSRLDDRSLLTIRTSEPLQGNYTVLKVADPPHVIIEMPGSVDETFEGPIEVGDGTIDRIVTTKMDGIGLKIEVSLASSVEHEIRSEGDILELLFEKPMIAEAEEVPVMAVSDEPAEAEAESASLVEEKAPIVVVGTEPKLEEKSKASEKPLKVLAVEFSKEGKYTRAEIITDGDPANYNAFNLKGPSRVVVDIANAREFRTKKSIKAVSPHIKGVRLGRFNGQVRVVFDHIGDVGPYEVTRGSDRITVLFGKKSDLVVAKVEKEKAPQETAAATAEVRAEVTKPAEPRMEEVSVAPVEASSVPESAKGEEKASVQVKEEIKAAPVADVKVEELPAVEARVEKAPAAEMQQAKVEKAAEKPMATPVVALVPEAATEEKTKVAEKAPAVAAVKEETKRSVKKELAKKVDEGDGKGAFEKVYNGQKVTLEFKDADIKNIFRVIAEVSGYNMIIDPAVSGKVTLRLVNVPWDQALDLILETNNLGQKKVGNVIRILPAALIKKEEEEKLAAKKAKEKLEDLVTKLIPISYAKADDLAGKMKGIMTDRGTTIVDERTSTIILKDIQRSVDEAMKLVESLDTPTRQVVIEARIVTANTNFARDLGVNWGAGYVADAAHGNPTGYYFPNSYNVTAGGGGGYTLNPPAAGAVGPSGGVMGISFGSINNTLNLDLRLSALESQGWGKVVSSPKIITLDNKEAVIQQGISIPFETTSAAGTQTTFVDANLNLTVTPHVTNDGRLSMKLKVSKNRPDLAFKGASGAPSIDKKEANTEILVKDGDTTVIGGIYEIDKGESETYTPFLGRIPVLGWLFKSKKKTETKTELLIFITPRIVQDKV